MSANTIRMTAQRQRYMSGKLTHDAYYLWLAQFIGATFAQVPFSREQIAGSTNEHLNDLPLITWDRRDAIIRPMAGRKGLPWSLSDTVCVLKALAKKEVGK